MYEVMKLYIESATRRRRQCG